MSIGDIRQRISVDSLGVLNKRPALRQLYVAGFKKINILDIQGIQDHATGMEGNTIDVHSEHLLQLILQLNETEQLHLIERVIALMIARSKECASQDRGARSLLELRGLGKELWDNVNANLYINEERNSWRQ